MKFLPGEALILYILPVFRFYCSRGPVRGKGHCSFPSSPDFKEVGEMESSVLTTKKELVVRHKLRGKGDFNLNAFSIMRNTKIIGKFGIVRKKKNILF